MAKRPSLSHQMWQQLESKNLIGKSRHTEKLIAKEQGSNVKTIHSYRTYSAYKQSSKSFTKWIKSKYPYIKYIHDIDRKICIEYIQYRENLGLSAYTYSQDMAMISKCLDIKLSKKECNVKNRSLKNITNSRIDNNYKTDSQVIETIIKGCGIRRNELEHLRKSDLIIDSNTVTGVKITKGGKGGKIRITQVRKDFQEPIYRLIENLNQDDKVIAIKIPKRLQTHRLRAEYAQNMINELIKLGRENPYEDLSRLMGHNRISVLSHYGVKTIKK